jgi:hypothetical protein
LRDASVDDIARCRELVITQASEELQSRSVFVEGFASARDAARLRHAAAEADERYLSALESEDDGEPNPEVHGLFGIARAYAALVEVAAADDREAVLEGIYELAVVSPERERTLLRSVEALVLP